MKSNHPPPPASLAPHLTVGFCLTLLILASGCSSLLNRSAKPWSQTATAEEEQQQLHASHEEDWTFPQ
jgi:uncharacterized protein YceK